MTYTPDVGKSLIHQQSSGNFWHLNFGRARDRWSLSVIHPFFSILDSFPLPSLPMTQSKWDLLAFHFWKFVPVISITKYLKSCLFELLHSVYSTSHVQQAHIPSQFSGSLSHDRRDSNCSVFWYDHTIDATLLRLLGP